MEDQELFKGYELKNWEFSPRIYKVLALSAIFNILALFVVAQGNLLTKKGCDSPLVGKVCQVIDTVVVGTNILTTNSDMVEKDYEKTELENSDIVWVDVTGLDKFNYPEGYFALSNPESLVPQEIPTDPSAGFPDIPGMPGVNSKTPSGFTPGFPSSSSSSNDLLSKKPKLPKPNKNAVVGSNDGSLFTFGDETAANTNPTNPNGTTPTSTPKGPLNGSNKPKEKVPPGTATVKPTPNPSATPEINKKPLKDFAAALSGQFKKQEVDLAQNFKVVANGVLTKDGKLDVSVDAKTNAPKSGVVAFEGDPRMVAVAKKAIEAIGDSGWLIQLQNQGIERFNFVIQQDNDKLQVLIISDFPTADRADGAAKGLQGVIDLAKLLDRQGVKKLGDDEKFLLNNIKTVVNPDKKDQFVLNFELPKPTAQELITRKLREASEEELKQKSNGNSAKVNGSTANSAK